MSFPLPFEADQWCSFKLLFILDRGRESPCTFLSCNSSALKQLTRREMVKASAVSSMGQSKQMMLLSSFKPFPIASCGSSPKLTTSVEVKLCLGVSKLSRVIDLWSGLHSECSGLHSERCSPDLDLDLRAFLCLCIAWVVSYFSYTEDILNKFKGSWDISAC